MSITDQLAQYLASGLVVGGVYALIGLIVLAPLLLRLLRRGRGGDGPFGGARQDVSAHVPLTGCCTR